MNNKKTTVFENSLIWFGGAVSVAEIITGTYFAPLGAVKGAVTIIIGHIIGCILLFLAGIIGGKTQKSAMETVKMSFGEKGSILFSLLNIIQLVGWTAIMIYDGAKASGGIINSESTVWCVLIGILIILWIVTGIKNLGKVNTVAMGALFVMTMALSIAVADKGSTGTEMSDELSFGAAVELSCAMPLSWLPLISDYTKDAEKPIKASAASAAVYGITSCWMYFIGMLAALFTSKSDIAGIVLEAGLGITGLLIVVLSTVTTTFMDVYSAGLSVKAVFSNLNSKSAAVAVAVIGTAVAIIFPLDDITDFLYYIGSVFAPMTAVLITSFFILKKDSGAQMFDALNFVSWLIGFFIYRVLMKMDIPCGSTLPDIIITVLLCIVLNKLFYYKERK